jgi:Amt family ammonium transporter
VGALGLQPGVHAVGGTWGALATGFFARAAVNPAGTDGLVFGNLALLAKQGLAVAVTWAFAAGMTYLILKLVDLAIGLRVEEREEAVGLDIGELGEVAYHLA